MSSLTRPVGENVPFWIATIAGIYAIIEGLIALVGWAFNIPRMTDWTGQGISVMPNTAACAALGGAAVLLLASRQSGWQMVLARIAAVAMAAFGGLTLLQHLTGADLGVDRIIFDRPWGQRATAAPMRMGPPASASFLVLGVALLLVTGDRRSRFAASILGLVTIGIASLSLTGYWFGADQLFGVAQFTGIALLTSLALTLIGAGVMALTPEHGLVAALQRRDAGGELHRRLILPIIIIPLVLGWLRLVGQEAGLYDTAFGTALRTLVEISLFLALLWWTASSLRRHESAARHADARLGAIIETSTDAIISKSLDGVVESWNAGAEQVFGYSAAEAVGKHISLIIPPERVGEETEISGRIARGERVDHYETIRIRKDGAAINVSLSESPITDEAGKVVGASKIARDVTERKRAEERLRAVVETTPDCVKIVAADGTIEFMNRAGIALLEGKCEAQVIGSSAFNIIAPAYREDWIERHNRVCRGERLNWEFEVVGLGGARRWMETHAVPLALPDGRVAQLSVTRDVSERRELERERERLLESERMARSEAERASRLKDEFLATLSHELRTPLNAIVGWSQILTLRSTPEDLEQGLVAIQRNARAQTQLIEDLLDMSRIISGKVSLDVKSIDLRTIVEAALDSVKPAADAKEIEVRTVFEEAEAIVSGDATRLQQVLWNLLSNAMKFTPKGGSVEVRLQRIGSQLRISVSDSGMGIKSEHLPVVFERFRQVDSSTTRTHGGLGLGLSIVKHLVELHGGTVAVESDGEGKGSTFIVELPVARASVGGRRSWDASQSAFESSHNGHVDLSGVKVLIVDDEADARALLERVLSQSGAEVSVAESAVDGLAQLRSGRPQVLVSDIGMPGTDGYEFIRQIRKLPLEEGGNTPAIALSAFARSEDRTRAMLAGFQVHLAKPIEPRELIATVENIRGGSGAGSSGTTAV